MTSGSLRAVRNPGFRVLQGALRADADSEVAVRAAAQEPVDWQAVQRLARFHGLLPRVSQRLREVATDLVPREAMRAMAAFQEAHRLHVSRLVAGLVTLVSALEAQGLPVMCLKGPVLAELLYRDPAMRCYIDVDLLVHVNDWNRAVSVVRGLGYVALTDATSPLSPSKRQSPVTDRSSHFACPGGGLPLELHWRVTTNAFPRALDPERLFARSRSVLLNGHPVPTLGPLDTTLQLCHHGAMHCWQRLCDVADLAASLLILGEERWDALLTTAQREGLHRPLLVGMQLCHALLGLALPKGIAQACRRDRLARRVVRLVLERYAVRPESVLDDLEQVKLTALMAEHPLRYGLATLLAGAFRPTESDYQWLSLPAYLRWAYPVLRPVRRVAKALGLIGKRLRRGT